MLIYYTQNKLHNKKNLMKIRVFQNDIKTCKTWKGSTKLNPIYYFYSMCFCWSNRTIWVRYIKQNCIEVLYSFEIKVDVNKNRLKYDLNDVNRIPDASDVVLTCERTPCLMPTVK